MFTGLVDDIGTIEQVTETSAGRELRIVCRYTDVQSGESIAVNGACMTVRSSAPGWFTVAAVVTTLERTAIGGWRAGQRVNLERSMVLGARLGGHLVQGHVDEVGVVREVRREADALIVDIEVSPGLFAGSVLRGSIAVDGVSLTVNAMPAENVVQISLIEYTLRHTTLAERRVGSRVQLEADAIGKYVRRLVAPYAEAVSD